MTLSDSCSFSVASQDSYKFTGKERDSESGLDNFGARHYASTMGRFMTPDYQDDEEPPDAVPNASASDPQTLNLYSYVGNRPTKRVDLDGHTETGPCFNDPNSQCFNGSYNGERDCSGSAGCLFWNGQSHEWQANDPTAPNSSDLPGWWFQGFTRLALNDPYGLKQIGYAYGKLALLPFGGWNLLKPPGVSTGSTGTSQAGGRQQSFRTTGSRRPQGRTTERYISIPITRTIGSE